MEINYFDVIGTLINFAVLFAIIIAIYKGIRGLKKYVDRNKDMDQKIDIILSKLEDKENKKDN